MNNTITEMKTTLEGIISRITETEEWISDLEDRLVEITATEQNKELLKVTIVQETSGSTSDVLSLRRRERGRECV